MKSEGTCNETIINCEWESMTYVEHVVSSTRRRKGHPAERSCCGISMKGKWPTSCLPAPNRPLMNYVLMQKTTGYFFLQLSNVDVASTSRVYQCRWQLLQCFARVLFGFPMTECKVQLTTLYLYKFMDFGIMSKRWRWVSKYKISDTTD